jgi:hypothetical protein
LRNYPFQNVSGDLTLGTGLAGNGEVFLEAARIFGNGEWQARADWIAQFLVQYFKRDRDGERYWQANGKVYPTANLIAGNCGVIHFLLRYFKPGVLSHPLLSC